MNQHFVKVISIHKINHDVIQITTEKPKDYKFNPGQATEVSINKPAWEEEIRPFTFTNLPDEKDLQFTIKIYSDHQGVTNELLQLKVKDELILHDVFGDIAFKGEGIFIAGGAGITPFISIFRYLKSQNKLGHNKLLFANKSKKDIILESEFRNMLGANFINILSDEKVNGIAFGKITKEFIVKNGGGINSLFYVCGPPPMMTAIAKHLSNLDVDENSIIKETI